jgi:hypothetical protein
MIIHLLILIALGTFFLLLLASIAAGIWLVHYLVLPSCVMRWDNGERRE